MGALDKGRQGDQRHDQWHPRSMIRPEMPQAPCGAPIGSLDFVWLCCLCSTSGEAACRAATWQQDCSRIAATGSGPVPTWQRQRRGNARNRMTATDKTSPHTSLTLRFPPRTPHICDAQHICKRTALGAFLERLSGTWSGYGRCDHVQRVGASLYGASPCSRAVCSYWKRFPKLRRNQT